MTSWSVCERSRCLRAAQDICRSLVGHDVPAGDPEMDQLDWYLDRALLMDEMAQTPLHSVSDSPPRPD